MYKKIVNPITNRKVNINTKLGQKIITNYLRYFNHSQMKGGGCLKVGTVECKGNDEQDGCILCPITMQPLDENDYVQLPNGTCYSRNALCGWLQHLASLGRPLLSPTDREEVPREWIQQHCPGFQFGPPRVAVRAVEVRAVDNDGDDMLPDAAYDDDEYEMDMWEQLNEDRAEREAGDPGDYDHNQYASSDEEQVDWGLENLENEAREWWRRYNGGIGTSGVHDDDGAVHGTVVAVAPAAAPAAAAAAAAAPDPFYKGQWPVIYDEHGAGANQEPHDDRYCPIVRITECFGNGYYEIEFDGQGWLDYPAGHRKLVYVTSLRDPNANQDQDANQDPNQGYDDDFGYDDFDYEGMDLGY